MSSAMDPNRESTLFVIGTELLVVLGVGSEKDLEVLQML